MKKLNYYPIILIFLSSLFSFVVYSEQLNNTNMTINHIQHKTKVNINTASAEELSKNLTGIGLNRAKKIVEYRDKFGPFVAIEQLQEVSGIGQSILDKNADKISL